MNELPPMVIAIWGPEGAWKTTFGLTFPKPLHHIETDVGGYGRASWRIDEEGITTESYYPPFPFVETPGKAAEVTVRFPKKLIGYKELWQRIFIDYVRAMRDPKLKTVVIDSSTELWTIDHRSYLQELQEAQLAAGKKDHEIRENLIPVEYADPNARMRQFINAAKSYRKNLVLIHYPKDVYITVQKGERTESVTSGEITIDGFKDTKKLVDVVVWMDFVKKPKGGEAAVEAKIMGKCALSGMGTNALGMALPEPSYQGIIDLRNMLMGE